MLTGILLYVNIIKEKPKTTSSSEVFSSWLIT